MAIDRAARHPFLDHPGPIPFAHRGGAGDFPENTMPAFAAAVAMGYRYLETDVQVTADGVIVAFHDDDLSRTCGREGYISALPWSEVATARVDGREPIPLFEDLMSEFPDCRVNIDCKSDNAVEPLIDSLRRLAVLDRVCVGSFSHARLKTIRAAFGDALCSSMSPWEVARWRLGFPADTAQVAQVPVKKGPIPVVTRRTVESAHRRGIEVHVWTIDEPEEMFRLLELHVDGIMTDRPAVLKQVMTQRGEWA
jgi:glycerophosphoryl diester phosphodiesterase